MIEMMNIAGRKIWQRLVFAIRKFSRDCDPFVKRNFDNRVSKFYSIKGDM